MTPKPNDDRLAAIEQAIVDLVNVVTDGKGAERLRRMIATGTSDAANRLANFIEEVAK